MPVTAIPTAAAVTTASKLVELQSGDSRSSTTASGTLPRQVRRVRRSARPSRLAATVSSTSCRGAPHDDRPVVGDPLHEQLRGRPSERVAGSRAERPARPGADARADRTRPRISSRALTTDPRRCASTRPGTTRRRSGQVPGAGPAPTRTGTVEAAGGRRAACASTAARRAHRRGRDSSSPRAAGAPEPNVQAAAFIATASGLETERRTGARRPPATRRSTSTDGMSIAHRAHLDSRPRRATTRTAGSRSADRTPTPRSSGLRIAPIGPGYTDP